MMKSKELQTQFMTVIEQNSDNLPEVAYSLATTIAREAVQVFQKMENQENVNPEYEHMLETICLTDLPNVLNTQTNLKHHPSKEDNDEHLYTKLISMLETVRTVEASRNADLMQDALSYTLANDSKNKNHDMIYTNFVRKPSSADEIAKTILPILNITEKA